MKKIARTIAMILVLVILASSFTSCFTIWAIKNDLPILLILTIPLDVFTCPLQLVGLLLGMDFSNFWSASDEMENKIYLANAEDSTIAEYYSLAEKTYSLPEEEITYLKQIFNSIPKTERISSIERLNSLSEERRVSLIDTYNSVPESEIISSIKRINALTETECVALLRRFNSLSELELDSLIEELKSLPKKEYVTSVNTNNLIVYEQVIHH